MANKRFVALTGELSRATETEGGVFLPSAISTNNITLQYDSDVSYYAGNIVEYEGKLYKALRTVAPLTAVVDGDDWATVAGGGLEEWEQAKPYNKGDVVWKDDKIYKANGTIPANSVIKVGSFTDSDASWTLLSTAGSVGTEFGSHTSITSGSTTTSATFADIPGSSFTLPSAGVWKVEYSCALRTNSLNASVRLVNSANAVVPNSATFGGFEASTSSNSNFDLDGSAFITTTGSATYKLQWAVTGGGTATIYNNYADTSTASDTAGDSYIRWQKISGFIPATGATTAFSSAQMTANLVGGGSVGTDITTVIGAQGNLPFSNGVWTLTAGVSYEFFATFSYDAGGSNQFTGDAYVVFCDATTNVQLPSFGAGLITPFYVTRGLSRSGTTGFTYTPTTNQTVKLRVTFQNNPGSLDAQAVVKQIGTTNTGAFTGMLTNGWNIANGYPSGTIVVRDGFLYQANAYIAPSTAFMTGTTGATWALLNVEQAEYGEAVPAANLNIPASNVTPQTIDVVSFTLPSAGVWEVQYSIRTEIQTDTSFSYGFLTNNSNTIVPNSSALVSFLNRADDGATTRQSTATQTVRITTTGAAVYKLRATASGSNFVTVVYAGTDGAGHTKVVWKKISGFLPLTPTLTSPNGTVYRLVVANNGSLSTVAV